MAGNLPMYPDVVVMDGVSIASDDGTLTVLHTAGVGGSRIDAIHVTNQDALNDVEVSLYHNDGADDRYLGKVTVAAGVESNILTEANFGFLAQTQLMLAGTQTLKAQLDGGGDGSDVNIFVMGGGY